MAWLFIKTPHAPVKTRYLLKLCNYCTSKKEYGDFISWESLRSVRLRVQKMSPAKAGEPDQRHPHAKAGDLHSLFSSEMIIENSAPTGQQQ